jgi:hypothetical protein
MHGLNGLIHTKIPTETNSGFKGIDYLMKKKLDCTSKTF